MQSTATTVYLEAVFHSTYSFRIVELPENMKIVHSVLSHWDNFLCERPVAGWLAGHSVWNTHYQLYDSGHPCFPASFETSRWFSHTLYVSPGHSQIWQTTDITGTTTPANGGRYILSGGGGGHHVCLDQMQRSVTLLPDGVVSIWCCTISKLRIMNTNLPWVLLEAGKRGTQWCGRLIAASSWCDQGPGRQMASPYSWMESGEQEEIGGWQGERMSRIWNALVGKHKGNNICSHISPTRTNISCMHTHARWLSTSCYNSQWNVDSDSRLTRFGISPVWSQVWRRQGGRSPTGGRGGEDVERSASPRTRGKVRRWSFFILQHNLQSNWTNSGLCSYFRSS